LLGSIPVGECDKCISSVLTGHGVHHQPQIPDQATFFKQGDEFVFVHVTWNLATEDLQAFDKKTKIKLGYMEMVELIARM
jgi:hypothetical protein